MNVFFFFFRVLDLERALHLSIQTKSEYDRKRRQQHEEEEKRSVSNGNDSFQVKQNTKHACT